MLTQAVDLALYSHVRPSVSAHCRVTLLLLSLAVAPDRQVSLRSTILLTVHAKRLA